MNLFLLSLIKSKENFNLSTKTIALRLGSFPLYNGKISAEFKNKFLNINVNGVQVNSVLFTFI